MLAFYFKSAVVVDFCFDLNICCLLVLAVKLKNTQNKKQKQNQQKTKNDCTKFLD